jgi:hypothetical protein
MADDYGKTGRAPLGKLAKPIPVRERRDPPDGHGAEALCGIHNELGVDARRHEHVPALGMRNRQGPHIVRVDAELVRRHPLASVIGPWP